MNCFIVTFALFRITYLMMIYKHDLTKGYQVMDTLTNWIAENPVVTTWITLISLVGVIITIIALILQIKDKKRRAIYYTITSTVLVDNEVSHIEGIKILYKDKEVDTVVISKIKLWNGGNDILEEADFYPGNELKIVVPEADKILVATIVEESDDTCNVGVQICKQKENEAVVSFYCLEPQQGATVNVYHTNVKEKETEVIGKIKGGKVLNKSVEVAMEDGEMCMSIGSHKISLSGGIFDTGLRMKKVFSNVLGISIVKIKKEKKLKGYFVKNRM
jgi:hypothetical protein